MTTYNQNHIFYTPQRTPKQNAISSTFSTIVTKPTHLLELNSEVGATDYSQQYRKKNNRDLRNAEKIIFFEEKTEELRRYLNENIQINKVTIQHIFGWTDEYASYQGTKQQILKHLSAKVKALIKQNHELRGNYQNEEILSLKKQNEELRNNINQLHRGEATREMILSQENKYLREYIQRHKEDIQRQRYTLNTKKQQNGSAINLLNENNYEIQQDITNLRKYIMNYINTIIEANDHQLATQQQYIQSLEKRISKLNTFSNLIEHLQFQNKVKLQESNRKAKNFTIGTPKILGDRLQYDAQSPSKNEPKKKQQKQPYFKSKGYKQDSGIRSNISIIKPNQDDSGKNNKQILALASRNAQLQQQLSSLQQKYDIQIEKHIRDSSEHQELLTNIQKLSAQKNQLKFQVTDLKERLIVAQSKYNNLYNQDKKRIANQDADFFEKSNMSIKDELNLIKHQLQAYSINKFEQLERQFAQLVHQRDFLRKQLSALQNTLTRNIKFSQTHKELFLLRQKNNQLEQNCRFYEDQLAQYQKQLRLISEQNENRLAKSISNDFKEMRMNDSKGLQWARQARSCMVNSINRLQILQSRLKYNKEQ